MNKVMIIGYLGRDPETRYVASGDAVTEFSVATSEKWTAKDGEQKERTEWFTVVAWGRQAEVCGEYLHKGSRVYIEGQQQTDTWEDKETKKTMYRTKLRLQRFEFLTPKGEESSGPRPEQSIAGTDEKPDKPEEDDLDDDIPF
jgi:single-strand DNA-binding protein